MRLPVRLSVLAIGLAVGSGADLAAQAELRASLGSFSGYLFRGLTLTSRPVVQPTATLVVPAGRVTLSLGGWANVEAGRYNAPTDLSEGGGGAAMDVTEFDWTAEAAGQFGKATVAVGSIGYLFPNPSAVSPVFNSTLNTVEIYSRVSLAVPLAPSFGLYYDVSKIKGAYFEGAVAHALPVGGDKSLALGLVAGWSAGQDAALDGQGAPTAAFYTFQRNGLSHVDVSAALPLTVAGLGVAPAIHVVYGSDPFAKLVATNRSRDVKFWFGGTISWAQRLTGRTGRQVVAEAKDPETKP